MTETTNLILIIFTVVAGYYCLRIIDSKLGNSIRPILNRNSDMNNHDEIALLKKELENQKKLFLDQLNAQAIQFEDRLEQQRVLFEGKIQSLQDHNNYLMERLASRDKSIDNGKMVDNNEMLFISTTEEFYCRDRTTLFRAGMRFTTLRKATSQIVSRELRHAREGGNQYSLIVVSAHGNENGIQLSDAIKPGEWWSQNLFGVDIAFFAACQSFQILNDLTGIVKYAVGMMDDIETELAEDFIYIFWREYQSTKNALTAFNNAKETLPELSDRIALRHKE